MPPIATAPNDTSPRGFRGTIRLELPKARRVQQSASVSEHSGHQTPADGKRCRCAMCYTSTPPEKKVQINLHILYSANICKHTISINIYNLEQHMYSDSYVLEMSRHYLTQLIQGMLRTFFGTCIFRSSCRPCCSSRAHLSHPDEPKLSSYPNVSCGFMWFPKVRGYGVTPKSFILDGDFHGFSIINHPFYGLPHFRKPLSTQPHYGASDGLHLTTLLPEIHQRLALQLVNARN